MIENHFDKTTELNMVKNLDEDSIKKFGCICIVQHHTKTKFDLVEIYKNSQVPFIYDCQSKLDYELESKTILEKLGN